jgi:hypothetical protein
MATVEDKNGNKTSDGLSVFGQFNANATAGTSPAFELGDFFATGQSARNISSGYRAWLGDKPPAGQ